MESPAEAAVDVGGELREARERKGLSLDLLSRRTKISITNLRHIEANTFAKLPHPVFLRGFVRAYAQETGLDPEETVLRYLGQAHPLEPRLGAPPEQADEEAAAARLTLAEDATDRGIRSPYAQWMVIAALVAIVGFATVRWRAHVGQTTDRVARATDVSQPKATREVVGTVGSDRSQPTAAASDVLQLALHARGPCWVSATAEGKPIIYRLMQAGERETVEVHDELALRVGDPAALTFSINGTEGRSLGDAGKAVTVRITKQNYRDFIR